MAPNWLHSSLHSLFQNTLTGKARPAARRRRPNWSSSPLTEAVETRTLLAATIINVDTFDDVVDSGDGLTSLREAVIHANSNAGDFIIQLQTGTYFLTLNGSGEDAAATGDLDILSLDNITIVGNGAQQTVINAGGDGGPIPALGDRGFDVHYDATLNLQNLTVTGGSQVYDGGGIRNDGDLNLTGVTVSGNSAYCDGGGIHNTGTASLTSSTVSHNNAEDGGGVFNYGGDLTLTNSTVSNNSAETGAGIYNEYGYTALTGSTVSKNTADYAGGGIYNEYGYLALTNSTVSTNTAENGGGVYNYEGDLTLTNNSKVSGNTANCNGGGVYNEYGDTSLDGSTVSGNSARNGGGLYNYDGDLTLTNSTVSGNSANYGAGIYNEYDETTLIGTTVTGNIAEDNGGGIYNYDGYLSLTSSTVSGNSAYYGGGVYNEYYASLTESTISGNTAYYGGGLYNEGYTTLTGSTVSGNTGSYGGGLYNEDNCLTLLDSTVSDNSAQYGGGIYNDDCSDLKVTNSTISGNDAAYEGGGVYNYGEATIAHSTIALNQVNSGGGTGGGITNYENLYLTHSIVAGNVRYNSVTADDIYGSVGGYFNLIGNADSSGGLTDATDGNIVGVGGVGTRNIATIIDINLADNGGPTLTHALAINSVAIDAGDEFVNCPPELDQRGKNRFLDGNQDGFTFIDIGAVEAPDYDVILVTTFNDVVNANDGLTSLREAIILANSTTRNEQIVLQAGTYNLSIGGRGENGALRGDLDILNNGFLNIVGDGAGQTIIKGAASLKDRVFHVHTDADLNLESLTVTGGKALLSDDGGGLLNAGGDVTITDSIFSGNTARRGAGVSNTTGSLTITNSTFSGNAARQQGGGVHNVSGCVEVTDSTFDKNSSKSNGGGLFNGSGKVSITSSTFSTNKATIGGGGFYNGGNARILNSTFSGNHAVARGGAIHSYTGTLAVEHSTIVLNTTGAKGTGGGIYTNAPGTTLYHTIVAGNKKGRVSNDIHGNLEAGQFNLIGSAGSSGGLTDGVDGNIVGVNGVGTRDITEIINTTLADNGGPTKTHTLVTCSVAINAGDYDINCPPEFDQRGEDRIQDCVIDIGAVEMKPEFSFGPR